MHITRVVIDVKHHKPIPYLADMIAGRAYTIDGVTDVEVAPPPELTTAQLHAAGFTLTELSLGAQEVHRT